MGELTALARERAQRYPDCKPHYSGCERDHLRCLLLMLADRIESLEDERDADKCRLDWLADNARELGLDYDSTPQAEPAHREAVLGAVARGWCHPKNAGKEMDVDLAAAITDEVLAINRREPTEAQIEARDALLDFISENGTASEGVQHYLDRYVRAALAAKEWVMDDDIVDRLLCRYAMGPVIYGEPEFGWRDLSGPAPEGMVLPTPLMIEAAAEIERLRAALTAQEQPK